MGGIFSWYFPKVVSAGPAPALAAGATPGVAAARCRRAILGAAVVFGLVSPPGAAEPAPTSLAVEPAPTPLAVEPAPAADDDEPMAWQLAPGRYTLIGRHPDSRRSYTGEATITRVGAHLRLDRRIAGRTSTVFGVVRRADPGEAYVLSFHWGASPAYEMLCLVGTDLDNYGRLTCHWGRAGNPHGTPGMEAYFAREPWEPLAGE